MIPYGKRHSVVVRWISINSLHTPLPFFICIVSSALPIAMHFVLSAFMTSPTSLATLSTEAVTQLVSGVVLIVRNDSNEAGIPATSLCAVYMLSIYHRCC